jgi:hypothetical protein
MSLVIIAGKGRTKTIIHLIRIRTTCVLNEINHRYRVDNKEKNNLDIACNKYE